MTHKYGAQQTVVDGIKFPSKAEARRYGELKLLQRAGRIDSLEVQPVFELTVSAGGRWTKLGTYRADFRYWADVKTANPREVVEDVKGYMTPLSKWKIKHVEAEHGITVEIVR